MTPDELDEHSQEARKRMDEKKKTQFFKVQNANNWMDEAQNAVAPDMLFGELWYEGELCIMFADTNLGKSILAVQIADSISSGRKIDGLKLEAPPQRVLYFDFELTMKQFQARYSNNYLDNFQFSPLFDRAQINPDMVIPECFDSFEEFLYYSLELSITEYHSKVLIIDNITYLRNEAERAKDALPLMKELKSLKDRYNVSILALAHTPKRDLSKPLTENDLGGSKMLMNFCDSAFAIGRSNKDPQTRYIKQIKQRNTEQLYGSGNVPVFVVEKPFNFLQFRHTGYAQEWQHLKIEKEALSQAVIEKIYDLHDKGMPQHKIAKELDISPATVNKYIKRR
jgi:DNA replication protein DnaC